MVKLYVKGLTACGDCTCMGAGAKVKLLENFLRV